MSNPMRLCLTVLAIASAWNAVDLAAAADFAVPLSVQESAGVARTGEPISGGVPLPKGQFKVDQPFALFTEDGREIPCQVCPLVVETDGTLRWILLDFQDNVAAGTTNRYVLCARQPSDAERRANGLSITDEPQAVTLDTGRMTLRVAKKRPFGLFEQVNVGGKSVVAGGEVSYVQMQGRKGWSDRSPWQPKKLLAGAPESVKVYYVGPLRATIEVHGKFADDPLGAGYQATITAWAGQSRALVRYKLCNSNPEQYTAILVNRSTIDLKLAAATEKTLLGADVPILVGQDGWLHQGLLLHHTYQDIAGAVKAGSGRETLWTGNGPQDRPQGWIAATAPQRVFAADKLFARNPARRLAVDHDRLLLDGIAPRFDGPLDQKFEKQRRVGRPWQAEGYWLYDCSHHSSEYLFDFAAPADDALPALAAASRNRLWALPPAEYISQCDVLGTGRFGTLEDEKACYKQWGWSFSDKQLPHATAAAPGAFVAGEDNHGESEADSVQGLLLMYVRTGQRGWFDQGEAWARYHADLQAWRTDGWAWKDGAIWFPSGGPQGNRQVRKKWNFDWGPNWGQREKDPDCIDLWRHCQSKSCYCHFYGSGLADYFCLTGDRDALAAALDNVEQKDDEFRHFRQFVPGKSEIGCIRGFGRGFEVMLRVLQADPGNRTIRELSHLAARTLWQSPLLDERGFHLSKLGGGFGGMAAKEITPPIKKWMAERGITYTTSGDTVDTLSKDGRTWPVRCMGGTWQHVYIHNGADLYARCFDDEDLRDFTIAFGQMSARYMLSPKCHQTWYYTNFDVPDFGMVFDPWAFEHAATKDGEGCVHSGWYTRFYPDACAKAFCLTGDGRLLARAKEFWYYGSKREYQTKQLRGGPNEINIFAGHLPPKDDTVLETARLFYAASHPRKDQEPPAAVTDLRVKLLGDGKAEVRFTAPADRGGGRVVRYQVKAAELPIAAYDDWDYARDTGKRRNWWRAANCRGEPAPSKPGAEERFIVTGLPEGETLYFAVRSYDESENLSAMSNVAVAEGGS